jgi:hypothetical protein
VTKKTKRPYVDSREAVRRLRHGDVETLANQVETSNIITLGGLSREERARFARTIRTGSPLTRGEKRENTEVCRHRDIVLTKSVFYWLGFGLPGFSNTSENTAFHAAVRDYESEVIKGAPARTAESLYRHVWRPYLMRVELNDYTDDDEHKTNSLREFRYGINDSKPEPIELQRRLEWFEHYLLRPGASFLLLDFEMISFRDLLISANISTTRWCKYLSIAFGRNYMLDEVFHD